ncbi:Hypp1961 [Branchiostoma lanceolatum]|uniref:Hypp1961 protein n=1 Tax=Branchiostoma lanceolatum TaxID=7740 RepID=A0A8J9ZM87_BRALA|nr:Hypp1961 [Branchiostoma lanceolatum]
MSDENSPKHLVAWQGEEDIGQSSERDRLNEEGNNLQEEARLREERKRKEEKLKEERTRRKEEKRQKREEERKKLEEEERRRLEEEEAQRVEERMRIEAPILDRLGASIQTQNILEMASTVRDFCSANLTDDTGLLQESEGLISVIQAQQDLTNTIGERNQSKLDEAVLTAERAINMAGKTALKPIKTGVKDPLRARRLELTRRAAEERRVVAEHIGHLLKQAEKIKRLEKLRHAVLQMNQATVSEIRNYSHPPQLVHQIMVATYLLLGVKESETLNWQNLQALMGKTGREGLKRRVGLHNPADTRLETAMRAKRLLEDFNVGQIQDVSAGAATFFVWARGVIQEVIDSQE